MLQGGAYQLLDVLGRAERLPVLGQRVRELRALVESVMSEQGDLQLHLMTRDGVMRLLSTLHLLLADAVATRMLAQADFDVQATLRAQAVLCAQAAPRTQALTRPVLCPDRLGGPSRAPLTPAHLALN